MGVSYALPSALPFEAARRPERTTSEPFVDDPAISDGDLIRRVARRDAYAFEALYRRYARPVFGLALRRLGDRMNAEDAVQETFAAIWRSARTYKPERGAGAPWLYAVARNAIVDRSRSRSEPPGEGPELPSDVPAQERERLRRAHELLIEAGPPAELSPELESVPWPDDALSPIWGRRKAAKPRRPLVLAAALATAAVVGFLLGQATTSSPTSI